MRLMLLCLLYDLTNEIIAFGKINNYENLTFSLLQLKGSSEIIYNKTWSPTRKKGIKSKWVGNSKI